MAVCVACSSSVPSVNQQRKLYSVSTRHVIALLCDLSRSYIQKLHSEAESEAVFSQDSVCMPGMFHIAGKVVELRSEVVIWKVS